MNQLRRETSNPKAAGEAASSDAVLEAEARYRDLLDAVNQIPIPEPGIDDPDTREPNGKRIVAIGDLPTGVVAGIERRGYFLTRQSVRHHSFGIDYHDPAYLNAGPLAVETIHEYEPALVFVVEHEGVLRALQSDLWIMRRPILVLSQETAMDLTHRDPELLRELLDKIDELCLGEPVPVT